MHKKKRILKKLNLPLSLFHIYTILHNLEPDCAFLDSSLQNDLGTYSIIGFHPYLTLQKKRGIFTVNHVVQTDTTFEEYTKKYLQSHPDTNDTTLPIVSGAIGYFSYDYGRIQHKIASSDQELFSIPEAILTFYDAFLIEDHHTKEITLCANGITQNADTLIQEIETLLSTHLSSIPDALDTSVTSVPACCIRSDFTEDTYKNAIKRLQTYMTNGDIYVANMTQQFTIQSSRKPFDVFSRLRKENPSPFGAYLDYPDFQIICASPERFLKMQKRHITTRPIKGTSPRGTTPEEDEMLYQKLLHSNKDKSELLMIVDLERNDLNRVCKPQSVQVTELFTVEAYATVFHLVANIEGDLREDKTVMDLLESAFPGGSITGAPKQRAMEIIDELELCKRNLYTGSLGYLTLDGDCDFNIVIRTAVHQNNSYYLGVGGGITVESDPLAEYEETLLKAKAILNVL